MISIKKVAIATILSITGLLVASFLILALNNTVPVVAFYGVENGVKEKVMQVLLGNVAKRKTIFGKISKKDALKAITLDNSLPLKKALRFKIVDLLFIYDSVDSTYIAKRAKGALERQVLSSHTSATRVAAKIINKKVATVPILQDFFVIDVNKAVYERREALNWEDIKKFSKLGIQNGLMGAVFSCGDDEVLVNTFGSVLASFGIDEYLNVATLFREVSFSKKATFDEYHTALKAANDKATALFKTLLASGAIDYAVAGFDDNDIAAFSEGGICSLALTQLSKRTALSFKGASTFETLCYPTQSKEVCFCVPILVGVPLSKNKITKDLLRLCVTDRVQSALSRVTAFSPCSATAIPRDTQADNGRYFASAAANIVPPLSKSAFMDNTQVKEAAKAIREVFVLK